MSNDKKKYAKIARKMEKRFGQKRKRRNNNVVQTLGSLRSFEKSVDGVRVIGQNGALSLRFMAPNLLQVRVRPDSQFPEPFSYAIDPNFAPETSSLTVSEDTDTVLVGAGAMACLVSRQDCHLRLVLPNGHEVSVDAGTGLSWSQDGVQWTRRLPPGEHCHGLGQRAAGLNLRGKQWHLWNHDPATYHRHEDPCYYSIPFYIGVNKDYALGVLWDNPARGVVDLGMTQPDQMTISAETGELRLYLIADENPTLVMKRYFNLTGLMPLPPLWVFGYHQSRWSYTPSNRFRDLAAEFRRRQIPCDVLHFDIDYMDDFRVFTWNPQTFGDIVSLIQELKAQGFKTISILDPAIKADPNYEVYQSGVAADIFYKYPDGSLFLAPVWAGESAFPDFTNPAARRWWADYVARLATEVGFDAFWNDMNEPAVFLPKGAGTIPDFVSADWEGQKSTHLEGAHNVYGMQMARATTEGMLRARPDERVFSLTRAAYAGAQRYTGSWTGDNVATWDHLRLSISMVLNLGLSGIVFTGPDIGGWADSPDPELYARWIQVGSMLPFCRTHTAQGTDDQEPWSFGTEVEAIARQYIGLRYQLLPYIYSSFAQCAAHGTPLVYPTFMYDPSDEKLANQDDAFMLGESLLIAPVLEKGATSREIYLPRGVWYDFHTNKLIDGAREIQVDAPLNHMPMYAKAGKIIPMWETMQYVGEKPIEELRLRAFAGPGETAIFEDSGEGLGYTQGQYRWSYFTCSFMPNGQFAIDWRTAGSYEPPYKKARLEVIGIPGEPGQVLVDGQPAPLWFFEGGHVEILSNPFNSVHLVGKARSAAAAADTVVRRKPKPPAD